MGGFFSAIGDVVTNEVTYSGAMRFAALLAFAAIGETIAEKAGTLNISLEGMVLGGAFAGALLTVMVLFAFARRRGGTAPLSLLLVGVVINAFFSALILFVVVTLGTDQVTHLDEVALAVLQLEAHLFGFIF